MTWFLRRCLLPDLGFRKGLRVNFLLGNEFESFGGSCEATFGLKAFNRLPSCQSGRKLITQKKVEGRLDSKSSTSLVPLVGSDFPGTVFLRTTRGKDLRGGCRILSVVGQVYF